VKHDNKTGTY
jgi:hypothetical protein